MKLVCILLGFLFSSPSLAWQGQLKSEIEKIDQNFEGDIGVVIKNLKDGSRLEYNADQKWYLSSTVKVLVAISLMEEIQEEDINLNQKVTLKEEHFIDGGGPILWSKPGEQFTVAELLKAMLRESDNTAADILIGLIGTDELNRDIKKWMPETGEITSLLDVRYLTYSELHPKARLLSNMDFIFMKNLPLEERHVVFAEKIKVPASRLKSSNVEVAHEKFYKQGYNSAKLQDYVELLEKLEEGKLLSKKYTGLIFNHMEHMKTGEHRLKAGLSNNYKFLQKTGTQIHRACNVGLIRKASESSSELALAVCIKKPSESINSDEVFKKIGQKVMESSVI